MRDHGESDYQQYGGGGYRDAGYSGGNSGSYGGAYQQGGGYFGNNEYRRSGHYSDQEIGYRNYEEGNDWW